MEVCLKHVLRCGIILSKFWNPNTFLSSSTVTVFCIGSAEQALSTVQVGGGLCKMGVDGGGGLSDGMMCEICCWRGTSSGMMRSGVVPGVFVIL